VYHLGAEEIAAGAVEAVRQTRGRGQKVIVETNGFDGLDFFAVESPGGTVATAIAEQGSLLLLEQLMWAVETNDRAGVRTAEEALRARLREVYGGIAVTIIDEGPYPVTHPDGDAPPVEQERLKAYDFCERIAKCVSPWEYIITGPDVDEAKAAWLELDSAAAALARRAPEGARDELEQMREALQAIAAVEPTPGKAARNVGAMLQMQALARKALGATPGGAA
jgi:hypothetical protein